MNNISNTQLPNPSDKVQNLETEVKHLIQLLGEVLNKKYSLKPIDPVTPTSLSPVLTHEIEVN